MGGQNGWVLSWRKVYGGQASEHRRIVHSVELQCMGGIWGASE